MQIRQEWTLSARIQNPASKDRRNTGNNNEKSSQLMKEYKSIEVMNKMKKPIRRDCEHDNPIRRSETSNYCNP
jgi:hypothetical protein